MARAMKKSTRKLLKIFFHILKFLTSNAEETLQLKKTKEE